MVLVLRTGVSDRELAQTKLEVLAHLPIRMLGAVLNDVRGGLYRYYSYYLEGYEVKEEPEPAWQLVRAPERSALEAPAPAAAGVGFRRSQGGERSDGHIGRLGRSAAHD